MNALLAITPTAILGAAVVDDLMTRKVHNEFFLAALAVALVHVLWFHGPAGLPLGLLGFLAGIFLMLPMVLFKMLGAGDMKILGAFGLATDWETVTHVVLYSLLWGALLGLFQVLLGKSSKAFFSNLFQMVMFRQRPPQDNLHKIPFTVALLFGWITHLAVLSQGGVQ